MDDIVTECYLQLLANPVEVKCMLGDTRHDASFYCLIAGTLAGLAINPFKICYPFMMVIK